MRAASALYRGHRALVSMDEVACAGAVARLSRRAPARSRLGSELEFTPREPSFTVGLLPQRTRPVLMPTAHCPRHCHRRCRGCTEKKRAAPEEAALNTEC